MAGAVYRLPPVAQFQQPRVYADVRSVDAPTPQPPTELYHLRRRPDYEVEQQPRRLLPVSVTQSVDSPALLPTPPIVNLRRRADYEADQQPQQLLDVSAVQSVDSPPGFPTVQPYERVSRFAGQQARGLDVSILAPVIVADNPTGNVTQALIYRYYPRESWQQRGPLDVSFTATVELVPYTPQPFYRVPPVAWQPWLQASLLDVSAVQSVDVPPGIIRQQPWTPPTARGAQWDQAVPGTFDIAVTVPFTPQAFYRTPPVNRQPWQQARPLDVSVTQSVDSPPGYFRQQTTPTIPGAGVQWRQAAPGLISAPEQPNPQFNPLVYARQVAATQAWQKSPRLLFPSVDSPPLRGLYPMAPYRRFPPQPPWFPTYILQPGEIIPGELGDTIRYREPGTVYAREFAGIGWREPPTVEHEEPAIIHYREPGDA